MNSQALYIHYPRYIEYTLPSSIVHIPLQNNQSPRIYHLGMVVIKQTRRDIYIPLQVSSSIITVTM